MVKGDDIIVKISDLIINFFISFAASAAFYFIIENHKKVKKVKKQEQQNLYDKKYIRNVKLQFYICFPISTIIMFLKLFFSAKTILSIFESIIILFLLLFSLFAFMCAMEVIDFLSKKTSANNSGNNN